MLHKNLTLCVISMFIRELVITFETKEVQYCIIRYNFCEMAEKACVKRLQKEYRALCKVWLLLFISTCFQISVIISSYHLDPNYVFVIKFACLTSVYILMFHCDISIWFCYILLVLSFGLVTFINWMVKSLLLFSFG